MKQRHKRYIRFNLISFVFVAISFLSVTLAWFAYSGLSSVSAEIGVKAWNIELNKNGTVVSNNLVISLSDISPGMETVYEEVNIKNLGDSDASLNYKIVSARIFNEEFNEEEDRLFIEDLLSHEYPFHININLSDNFILKNEGIGDFKVSISWPLDSGNNEKDSFYGNEAYNFSVEENLKKIADENYQIKPSIQIVITVTAEQYIENEDSYDLRFPLGKEVLYDINNDKTCNIESETCIKTYVIDNKNKIKDNVVNLLPEFNYVYEEFNNYDSSIYGWNVNTRDLVINDVLNIISNDVLDSFVVINGISDKILGNLVYENRMNSIINKVVSNNGYFMFSNFFDYLVSDSCYWINNEYDSFNGFAINKIDSNSSKIYKENKSSSCYIIPIIVMEK